MTDLDLIDLIYQAALEPERWRLVAPALTQAFDSKGMQISVCRSRGEARLLSSTADYAPRIDRDYAAYFRRIGRNPAVAPPERGAHAEAGDLESDEAFIHIERYTDDWRYLDIFHCMGVRAPSGRGDTTAVGIHHRSRRLTRDGEEIHRLRRIQRHIARAVQMSASFKPLGDVARSSLDILDRLPFPILVVTAGLGLRLANRAGHDFITAPDSAIRRRGERIEIIEPALRARLNPAIRAAIVCAATDAGPDRQDVVPSEGSHDTLLRIEVCPIRTRDAGFSGDAPAAMLCINRAAPPPDERVAPVRSALRATHDLTRAESDVAIAIMQGQTVAAYAGARGVSVSTVRSQLRQVFAKTGCRRQADLVRILYPSVQPPAAPPPSPG